MSCHHQCKVVVVIENHLVAYLSGVADLSVADLSGVVGLSVADLSGVVDLSVAVQNSLIRIIYIGLAYHA